MRATVCDICGAKRVGAEWNVVKMQTFAASYAASSTQYSMQQGGALTTYPPPLVYPGPQPDAVCTADGTYDLCPDCGESLQKQLTVWAETERKKETK